MEGREIVRRAIEFDRPPRLPFFLGTWWCDRLRDLVKDFPNDVFDVWEMDRQQAGWYFDHAAPDDWGCAWKVTAVKNMGQVVGHPLADWSQLDSFRLPNPRNPFYYQRFDLRDAGDKYVVLTSHFALWERFHMLRGFANALQDFHLEPEKTHRLLDRILEYQIEHLDEAARRFGDRVHGIFLTDDWGTQRNTFVSPACFREFFLERYRKLYAAIHAHGWHAIQHSCGRINLFVPLFIEAGVDVMNMQQPCAYGPIAEFGGQFAGKVCFLTTVDIQNTLPKNDPAAVRNEARDLVEHWSKPEGGFIVFNYGDAEGIGTTNEITEVMFQEFYRLRNRWSETA